MDTTKTTDKFQLTDEQFNEIRIMAGKISVMGEFLRWTNPLDFYPGLPEQLHQNLGDIITSGANKIEKCLNGIETDYMNRRKERQARKEVHHCDN